MVPFISCRFLLGNIPSSLCCVEKKLLKNRKRTSERIFLGVIPEKGRMATRVMTARKLLRDCLRTRRRAPKQEQQRQLLFVESKGRGQSPWVKVFLIVSPDQEAFLPLPLCCCCWSSLMGWNKASSALHNHYPCYFAFSHSNSPLTCRTMTIWQQERNRDDKHLKPKMAQCLWTDEGLSDFHKTNFIWFIWLSESFGSQFVTRCRDF